MIAVLVTYYGVLTRIAAGAQARCQVTYHNPGTFGAVAPVSKLASPFRF